MKGFTLEQCLEWDLKEHVSKLLIIPREKIDKEDNLADFGFDSISLGEFSESLTNYYGIEITPVLFFAYSTLSKLIQYLLTEYQITMQLFYQNDAEGPEPILPSSPPVTGLVRKRQGLKSRFTPDATGPSGPEPIAVIGMSGRFPQSNTISELWTNLREGKSCITEIPADRWEWEKYYGTAHSEIGTTDSKWGGFMTDVDQFDPLFFEISPKEATYMDPKQRLFLEEAWHAFEDAGYMGKQIRGTCCGVYVGVEEGDYGYLSGGKGQINSNQNATLAARIAYALDLKGPNLALTAACSSGLVAIHQACQALRQGDCEMALVGGVSLLISPLAYIGMSEFGMLSSDGKCYVFDKRANGLVPGEAVAVVLLKPLSKAILDNDQIYGCIKASGVNYDGKTNGITAPNPLSQVELLNGIYQKYHINPADIQYVMAHSVGSKLGDPLEVQALSTTFSQYTTKKQYCSLGSIKPLIGHTFAASGVVSLITMLLAMKHQTILALHNYEASNEYIRLSDSPFMLNTENQTWKTGNSQPRLGAISTTGISGTNAHAVIEEYLPGADPANTAVLTSPANPILFVLSAKSEEQLQIYAAAIKTWIESQDKFSLPDMAYTLQVGREAMEYRLAFVADSRETVLTRLEKFLGNQAAADVLIGKLENDNNDITVFAGDGNVKSLLPIWFQRKELRKIAEVWVRGFNIVWNTLYANAKFRRISLPNYPFARERYWIQAEEEHCQTYFACQSQDKTIEVLTGDERQSLQAIEAYITQFLSSELNLAKAKIKTNRDLRVYGVDSIISMKLARDFERRYQAQITGREMLECRTIKSLANLIAAKLQGSDWKEQAGNKAYITQYKKNYEYKDQKVIDALEKLTRGSIALEAVQKLLEEEAIV